MSRLRGNGVGAESLTGIRDTRFPFSLFTLSTSKGRLQPIDFKAFGFEIFIVKWVFLSFNRKM